ncbi:hypothetical protein [Streptomyces sp. NBC_01198]|nr:hypothetical protein OG702_03635 [Streptomyces sp. NBC_01198]
MQDRMELAYQGWPTESPLWALMTVLVIVFALAAIVRLLRDKH